MAIFSSPPSPTRSGDAPADAPVVTEDGQAASSQSPAIDESEDRPTKRQRLDDPPTSDHPPIFAVGSWPSTQLSPSKARRRDRDRQKKAKRKERAQAADTIALRLLHVGDSEAATPTSVTAKMLPRASTETRGLQDRKRMAYAFLKMHEGAAPKFYVLVGHGYDVILDDECL